MPLPRTTPIIVTEKPAIILASASPRRHQLLLQIQLQHQVQAVEIDESCHDGETPQACAERLALIKAREVLLLNPESYVIGADTIVSIDGKMLGKPVNRADGLQMLESLSAREHQVMTGVAVVCARQELSCVSRSKVTFKSLSKAEIMAYWDTGEPLDKAGAYAIQGIAARFVKHLNGSFSGVMGLPLYETSRLLEESGATAPRT